MLKIINQEHYEKELEKARENGSIKSLEEQLEYLNTYACTVENPYKTKVHIGFDHSGFSILWMRLDKNDVYQEWMYGGLIYHASDNSWSIHT